MKDILTILYTISPVVFFVGLYYLFFMDKKARVYKIWAGVFILNFLLFIFLIIRSYRERYISLYYGILGIIGFILAARGTYKYFFDKSVSKEQKIVVLIYVVICLIIGFGMCSTTGVFGF